MTSGDKTSAVRSVARQLRADSFGCEEGELLGSEDALLERYGVSRPTLRQAVALLVQEQLLVVKRGPGGGYFARRPSEDAVAHAAAIFLQSKATTLREIIYAILPVKVEMVVLACRNRDPLLLEQLAGLLKMEREEFEAENYKRFLRSEVDFGKILGRMCRNHVLKLFLDTLYKFCSDVTPEQDVYINRPERVTQYWALRNRMVEAIIEGDEEVAAIMARRAAMLVAKWMGDGINHSETHELVNATQASAIMDYRVSEPR